MMGDFAKVCREGAAIYPYKMVDEGSANCIAEKEMNMLAGKGLLVQQNPLECNPADQDDPRNQNDGQTRQLWEAFQGRCVVWIIIAFSLHCHCIISAVLKNLHHHIKQHKTGKNYKLFVYFREFMQFHLMHYQDVVCW